VVEPVGFLIVGLFAVGMGVSFFTADPQSPTSRALSLMFGLLGVSFLMNIAAEGRFSGDSAMGFIRFFSLTELAIMVAGLEWIRRIGRTIVSPSARDAREGEGTLRIAQGLACLYGLAGATLPWLRLQFWNVPWTLALLQRPQFYLFALPFNLSLLLGSVRIIQLLRSDMDPAERLRLVAFALTTPFWSAGLVLRPISKPVSWAIGEVIFLVAAIRYHVLQGQRGEFLARFVSPQVVHLARERGLAGVMPQSRVEISVVACDLRGFTAFSESAAPEEIMSLLSSYYGAVGEVVTELGGSVKDFAGDGIVVLVGAPVTCADHAQRAVAIALGIRERTRAILSHWNARGLQLGLGIAIATGFVTVGVIGGIQRLEYTAVGPAMNLAARLCSRAEAAQILTDQRTVGSIGQSTDGYRFEPLETAELKGFARPVPIFTVVAMPERSEE